MFLGNNILELYLQLIFPVKVWHLVRQSIVDSEVIEMEESGNWGEMGNSKAAKKAKVMDLIKNHKMVGKHNWVEDKDWWRKHALDMDVSNPDDKCKDGGQVATFDGAGGVGNGNADEKETGDVVEDEDKAGEHTEGVAEGTMPGGEDTEETSAPVGADGVADAAANEAGESTKEAEVEQPPD